MIVVVVSICFTVVNVAAILVDWLVFTPILSYVTLFYGVFIGYFSVRRVYYCFFLGSG